LTRNETARLIRTGRFGAVRPERTGPEPPEYTPNRLLAKGKRRSNPILTTEPPKVKRAAPGLEHRPWGDLMRGQTGASVSDLPTWLERERRYLLQDELTRRVAGILEAAGVPAHRAGSGFALVGLVTGAVKPAEEPYRRIHFLPAVAASLRAELANGLELYLAINGRYARYAVMTTGQRCELHDLRARIVRLNRLVSRWAHTVCRPLGVEVAFRSIELPCDDAKTFHVHANVVYWPTRAIPKKPWKRFLRETRAFFGAHWKDNGRLKEVREVVKYMMKAEDVAGLADNDPAALVELYHELRGLHLVQPLGWFRDFRRQLDADGLKVVPEYGPRGRRLVVTRRPTRPHRDLPPAGLPKTNQVLSIDLPRAAFCHYREPVLRVSNLDVQTLWHDPQLLAPAGEALADWTRNGAPPPQVLVPTARGPFTVHTCTPAVRAPSSPKGPPAVKTAIDRAHQARAPPE